MVTALRDGRMLVAGGHRDSVYAANGTTLLLEPATLASVELLAAGGPHWVTAQPMQSVREGAAVGLLACGRVIVAGGRRTTYARDDYGGYNYTRLIFSHL
jgi:hypothetical protein